MLEGLDAIRWADVQDGMAEPELIPALLRELPTASPARFQELIVELGDMRLVDSGKVSPAAKVAAPFVHELLLETAPKQKDALLLLLAQIAIGDVALAYLGVWPRKLLDGEPGFELERECYQLVREWLPSVVAQLKSRRALSRAMAALVLGLYPPEGPLDAVRDRLAKEKDGQVVMSLLLALANWVRCFGLSPDEVSRLVEGREDGPAALGSSILRADCVLAAGASDRSEAILALRGQLELAPSRIEALGISPKQAVFHALMRLDEDAAFDAGLAGFKAGNVSTDQLMRLVLPPPPGREPALIQVFSELTERQQSGLARIARELEGKWHSRWSDAALWRGALPSNLFDLKRFTGVMEPGPLERELRVNRSTGTATIPYYKLFRDLVQGALGIDDVRSALAGAPPPEAIEALILSLTFSYELKDRSDWAWHDGVREGLSMVRSQPAHHEGCRRSVDNQLMTPGGMLVAVYGCLMAKDTMPALFDSLDDRHFIVATRAAKQFETEAREVLSALEGARRDRVLKEADFRDKLYETASYGSLRLPGDTFDLAGWLYLDLAHDREWAAKLAVSKVAAWQQPAPNPRSPKYLPDEAVYRALSRLRPESIAAVEAGLSGETTNDGRACLERFLERLTTE